MSSIRPHHRSSYSARGALSAPAAVASAFAALILIIAPIIVPIAAPIAVFALLEARSSAATTPRIAGRQNPPSAPQQQSPQTPPAREPRDTEPVARIETELVQIDVVVTDGDGKLVGNLKREDFQILEDGRPQQITHFAAGSAGRPARWLATTPSRSSSSPSAGPAAAQPVEVLDRYIVLAVDDFHLAPENLYSAKQALRRFVRDQMAPGDQVAIATTSGTLGLLQQFTSERDVLARAIDRLAVQQRQATSPFDIPRITDYQAELIDLGDPDALELAIQEILRLEGATPTPPTPRGNSRNNSSSSSGTGGEGALSARERAANQARGRARMIVAENAHYTSATLRGLEATIRNLGALPGRKMIVLVSDGFFLGGSNSSKHFDIRRITDAATRAGVVIYSIDARGLYATNPAGDASQPSGIEQALPGARFRIEASGLEARRDGLNALARDTGGFPVFNNNDLSLGMKRILADNETYYVLAWEPEVSYRDGRFRQVEVKLPNHPKLKVRTRKGYFAPDERAAAKAEEKAEERMREIERKGEKAIREMKQEQIRAGLSSLFPLRAVPVELAADFIDTAESGSLIAVTAHIEAATLRFSGAGGPRQTSLDIVTIAFDEKGKAAANISERIELNLRPQVHDFVVKHGITYRKMIPLKPGFYQVRLAVREEGSGQLGSATRWVEVTDTSQKKLTLSSILVTAAAPPEPGTEGGDSATKDYVAGPTQAVRRFSPDASIDFLVFAYNPKLENGKSDLVIQSQVFSGSKLIYSAPLTRIPPDGHLDPRRIPYAARLSLSAFDPGEYELRVMVIDRLAKATADRKVNFTVVR